VCGIVCVCLVVGLCYVGVCLCLWVRVVVRAFVFVGVGVFFCLWVYGVFVGVCGVGVGRVCVC